MMPFKQANSTEFSVSSNRHWNWALSFFFLASALGTIVAIIYVLTSHRMAEKFTEFYILGSEGKAENYPSELSQGQEGKIILGIINQEHRSVYYELQILVDERDEGRAVPIFLNHKEKWEQPVTFKAARIGLDQKVEFRLYKEKDPVIYRSLYLWINVKPRQPA